MKDSYRVVVIGGGVVGARIVPLGQIRLDRCGIG